MSARVLLPRTVKSALVHAMREAAPREVVGVLGGHRDRDGDGFAIARFVPLPTSAATAEHFEVCPLAFARAEAALREGGLDWLGFAHSHPVGSANPSLRDRRELWPDCLHLIVGPGTTEPQLLAFRLQRKVVVPLPLECA